MTEPLTPAQFDEIRKELRAVIDDIYEKAELLTRRAQLIDSLLYQADTLEARAERAENAIAAYNSMCLERFGTLSAFFEEQGFILTQPHTEGPLR